ncbi:hypothetical protein HDV06_006267 [Boothiomyces sp. JEL0866]|nr:hypothetical protein HDV06_006267 [Boothiomyces sp. JEL0866]
MSTDKIERYDGAMVEKYLQKEKSVFLEYLKQPKLLVLGSSDSGKSTLLKQMKIMHNKGFTKVEKQQALWGIKDNILSAISKLLRKTLGIDLEDYADFIEMYENWQQGEIAIPHTIKEKITQLWSHPAVQDTFAKKAVAIPDTTP